jgi:GNAT superfamily N-acetyltransferase
MAPFQIRNAQLSELPSLSELELRAAGRFLGSGHAYAADLPPFETLHLAELAAAGRVWVAADDALIWGFAVGGYLGGAAYLHEIDVEPALGRQGAGRALVRAVAAWAAGERQPALLLSTFSDVPWNAPFYAKLGFEVVPAHAYDEAMRRLREDEARGGLVIESRVIMRAQVARLLAV